LEQQFSTTPNVTRSADPGASKFSIVFSNACCCIRRERLTETPFEEVRSAEDRVWASAIVERGFGIAYEPTSIVRHSHAWSLAFIFNKGFKVGESVKLVGEAPWYIDIRRWTRWRFLLANWREWYGQAKAIEPRWLPRVTGCGGAMLKQFCFEAGLWRSGRKRRAPSGAERAIVPAAEAHGA
jgi:hypothetical protein